MTRSSGPSCARRLLADGSSGRRSSEGVDERLVAGEKSALRIPDLEMINILLEPVLVLDARQEAGAVRPDRHGTAAATGIESNEGTGRRVQRSRGRGIGQELEVRESASRQVEEIPGCRVALIEAQPIGSDLESLLRRTVRMIGHVTLGGRIHSRGPIDDRSLSGRDRIRPSWFEEDGRVGILTGTRGGRANVAIRQDLIIAEGAKRVERPEPGRKEDKPELGPRQVVGKDPPDLIVVPHLQGSGRVQVQLGACLGHVDTILGHGSPPVESDCFGCRERARCMPGCPVSRGEENGRADLQPIG